MEYRVFLSFLLIVWGIWCARNDVVFNNSKFGPHEVVHRAILCLNEYSSLNKNDGKNKIGCNHITWSKPRSGLAKINIDGVVFGSDRTEQFGSGGAR